MLRPRWGPGPLLLLVALGSPLPMAAQEPAAPPVIRSIALDREDIFDAAETDHWYQGLLNSLHVRTRQHVIRRELLLKPGQPYDSALAAETERNLRQLGIFREVEIDTVTTDSGMVVRVITHDAWTTYPYIAFKSSGGQVTWGLGISEANFLGNLARLGLAYQQNPDRSSFLVALNVPRAIANRVGVNAAYQALSDGTRAAGGVVYPFTSLSSRVGAGISGQLFDGRVLQYFDGASVAQDTLQQRFGLVLLSAGYALRASANGYVRIGLQQQFRRDDFEPESFTGSFPRTLSCATTVSVTANRARFLVTRDYRNMGPQEDVDLSPAVRLGLSVAPKGCGYSTTGLGPLLSVSYGAAFHHGFVVFRAGASSLFSSGSLDSGTVVGRGTLVLQPHARHMAVFDVDVGLEKNPYPGEEFDLGLTYGPRGFPQHAFTGDRAFFTMAEYRWTTFPDLGGLFAIGVAGFVDYGGAWYDGSPTRTGLDTGGGLRIGSLRSASFQGAIRLDLVYRFGNGVNSAGWTIAVGSGFPFDRTLGNLVSSQ